jgi:membrane-associated phospholipid phosphatase
LTPSLHSRTTTAMRILFRPWPLPRNPLYLALAAAGLVALLYVVHLADGSVAKWGQSLPDPIRAIAIFITDFGRSEWILIPSLIFLIVTGALAFFLKRPITTHLALKQMTLVWAFVFAGVAVPGLFVNLVKRLIGRGRPELFDIAGPTDFRFFFNDWTYQSFPSGHTTTAFAFALVLGFLSPRWLWLGLVYAVLIGLSRIIVGAHYPTDVIGGIVVGVLGAYAIRNFFCERGWLFRRQLDGSIQARPLSALQRLAKGSRATVRT